MSFPPMPPISLNVSDMEISDLKLDNITFDEIHFDLPLKPIYILFIALFVINFLQLVVTLKIMIDFKRYANNEKNKNNGYYGGT